VGSVPLVPEKKPILLTGPAGTLDHLTVVRAISKVMDTAFTLPGTNFKFGVDAVVGLIPVVGDVVGGVIGTYIIFVAAKMGVPKPVLTRMLMNVGADAVAGAVPVVGDALDAAWRANAMNVRLLEQSLAEPRAARRQSWALMLGLIAAVIGIVAASVALTVWIARLVWNAAG
jgi:hypothetical protein